MTDRVREAPEESSQTARAGGPFARLAGRALSLPALLYFSLFWAIGLLCLRPAFDWDLWWHLEAGEWIWEHRAVPWHDPFSYMTEGRPWHLYYWLSEVLFYAAASTFGREALIGVRLVLILATFALVLRMVRSMGLGRSAGVGLTGLVALLTFRLWNERPYLFSYFFMALTVCILFRLKRPSGERRDRLWLLPPLFALWANLHIQFIYGLILLVAFTAGEWLGHRLPRGEVAPVPGTVLRRLSVIALLCAAATLLNPYTWRIYAPVLTYATHKVPPGMVVEFFSPSFHYPFNFILLLLFALAASELARRTTFDWTGLLLLVPFSYFAFTSRRDVMFFAIAAAPLYARGLAALVSSFAGRRVDVEAAGGTQGLESGSPTPVLVLHGLVILLLLALIAPVKAHIDRVDKVEDHFPVEAVRFLKDSGLGGRLYNTFNWGGYLIYHLYPDFRVSMDGRTQVYGDELLGAYRDAYYGHAAWDSYLEQCRPDVILYEKNNFFAQILEHVDGWTCTYEDDMAVVYVRSGVEG